MMFDNPSEFIKFINNPTQYLLEKRADIPQGMTDPNQIVQHLLLTGQISQDQYNKANQEVMKMQQNGQMGQLMQFIQQNRR